MNRSMPGLPVHHQLPEFTQTHVHRVSDAIHCHLILCHPLSSCPQSLPASKSFPMSQLFAWGGQSTGVSALASFLPKKCGLFKSLCSSLPSSITLAISLTSRRRWTEKGGERYTCLDFFFEDLEESLIKKKVKIVIKIVCYSLWISTTYLCFCPSD